MWGFHFSFYLCSEHTRGNLRLGRDTECFFTCPAIACFTTSTLREMKIFGIGMNYAPFFIPDYTKQCEYETELVVRINHLGRSIPERFAHRYYDEISVGIDFTARDLQKQLRQNGLPWDICKGFDGSAAVGQWVPLTQVGEVQDLHFHLDINGHTVQSGYTGDMLHSVDSIISYISRFFTIKTGDIIFTGTPAGVGPVQIDDHLQAYLGERIVLDFHAR